MTIEDMQFIMKIAELGSVTKAAKALYISQPSLSQRLQKVETELGARLFERSRFGEVSPTAAGRVFCSESEHILTHWERLQEKMQSLKGKISLTMGIPVRTGYELVTGLLGELKARSPNISLTYLDKPNYVMEEMIARGEMDLGLVRMANPNRNYSMRPISAVAPYVYLRKGSPLWEKVYYHQGDPMPYLDLRLLEEEPLVAAPAAREHRSRQWTEMILSQIPDFHGRIEYTVPNVRMFDSYLKNGTASCITSMELSMEYACRIEPEYAIPYTLFLVQNNKVDREAADIVYEILCKTANTAV